MDVSTAWRAARQWVPFALRTIGYGTVSLTLGPLTRDHRASLWAMRRWSQSSARGLDIEIEASGLENVPAAPFVYCSNHQSIVDILVLGAVLPGDFKWAAKRSLMKIPFLGWHLTLAGHVPVDRAQGSRAAAHVIARFEETLRAGKPLLVFPEGTRTPTGAVQPFKNGGFHAAVRAGVPVVPVALEGTYSLMRRDAVDTGEENDRRVRVRVGAPVQARTDGREAIRVNELRERTYDAVVKLHESIGGKPPSQDAPASEERARAGAPAASSAA
jgi:1-acyl-sn-glycerol-3-phosphate acyltransferase